MAKTKAKIRTQSSGDFIKHQVLPFLAVFIIPAFSLWFFNHADSKYDETMLEFITSDVQKDRSLTADERKEIMAFYTATPVSKIMASDDPEMAQNKEPFAHLMKDYQMFFWARWIAGGCLMVVLVTLLIVGVSVAASFRSQAYQYYALKFGWSVLRISALLQVVGQSVLAVLLSYWIPALWTEKYYVKLIAIIGILAVLAVVTMVKAIFHRVNMQGTVEGELVTEEAAPELWQRVRDMAIRMKTAPPDRIVTGIDADFFVTENPVKLGDQVLHGRTLYVSLPMLKIMTTEEADAVLGHEMAHFAGEDTLWGQKIGPIIGSMEIHIAMLAEGISKPVAYFMHFFWKLYQISLNKLSRAREFRADLLGAEMTSADSCKRMLVKVSSYCQFRGRVEERMMKDVKVDEVKLAKELEAGYAAHLKEFTQSEQSFSTEVAHPFDTHPKLSKRLENLGFDKSSLKTDASLLQEVTDSWYHKIKNSAELEARLWKDREDLMQGVKKENLSWTCLPEGPEEIAIVVAAFPEVKFRNKAGEEVVVNYERTTSTAWPDVIEFVNMDKIFAEQSIFGGKRITIQYRVGKKLRRVKFATKKFPGTKGEELAETVNRYHLRCQNAQYHAKFEEWREERRGRR